MAVLSLWPSTISMTPTQLVREIVSIDAMLVNHCCIIDKVILFLTDGLPTDEEENILNGIADRNAKLKNSVVILTYGLAGEIHERCSVIIL